CLCGLERQHALVQHDDRLCHADRPLFHAAAFARHSGLTRPKEANPSFGGYSADPWAAVRGASGWRDHHRGCPYVPPGLIAGTDCGASHPIGEIMNAELEQLPDVFPLNLAPSPDPILPAGKRSRPLFDPPIMRRALLDSVRKLHPGMLAKNPVMFVVALGALLTTVLLFRSDTAHIAFNAQIAIWLWFTVLFANFAEAMAEGRGKAQAETLRKAKTETVARKSTGSGVEIVPASTLRKGDVCVCYPDDIIPGDGEVIEGIASVDESVITGESAPVIRETGGDRSAVTGGTKVLSDFIKIKITSNPGETFLDRMIALVEGAQRQKAPNEIALNILISGLTLIFLLAVTTLLPFANFSIALMGAGAAPAVNVLVALLVCLIPTTIGGLLPAIGIAGMHRVMRHNVLAMSGKAVEACGDINTLLLDKTGTITLGNREAVEFWPAPGITAKALADVAQLAS